MAEQNKKEEDKKIRQYYIQKKIENIKTQGKDRKDFVRRSNEVSNFFP